MMNPSRGVGLVLGILLVAAGARNAPAEAARVIDLDTAQTLALENNALLRGQAAAVDASRWRSRSSTLAWLPRGAFTSSVTRVADETLDQANQAQVGMQALFEGLSDTGVPGLDGIVIDPFLYRDSYRSSLSLNQDFPLNLNLIGGSRAARAGERAARRGHEAARDALLRDVRLAYFRLLAAEALLQVAEEGLAGAENRLSLARDREDLGMINRSERLLWDVAVAESKSDLAAARTGRTLAEMELNHLLGQPLTTVLDPIAVSTETLADARELADTDPAVLSEHVVATSPNALAIEAGEEVAAAGKLLAFSGLTPSLHFSFNYGWRENDTAALDDYDTWSATALVNVPLFDLPARWSDYRVAAAEERRSRHESSDARERLRLAAHAAWHEVRLGAERLRHRESAREQAEETLKLMGERHAQGHVSEFDLVDVQTAATAARAAAVLAHYDYYGALAALESLIGGTGTALDAPAKRSEP